MLIKLLVDGGDMKPRPVIGQKLGPLGINIGEVIKKVNSSTSTFKGLKIPVELNVNKDKTFDVKVLSPPTTELLKKELKIEKASGEAEKIKVGNASIEQIISVAKIKHPNMLDKDFKSAVKSVVGSCVSSGVLIEDKPAKDVERDIDSGKYNKEIQEMKTETSPEKKKKLDAYFNELSKKQEEVLKKEEEEKAAEEAKKAEAITEEGKKPAEAGEAVESAEKKPEEKKEAAKK